jgi:hypothetical protein
MTGTTYLIAFLLNTVAALIVVPVLITKYWKPRFLCVGVK